MNTQISYAQIIALCSMFFHMDNGTKDDLGPNRNDVRDFQKWGDMQTMSPKDAFAAVKRLGKYRSTQLKGLLQSNQLDPSLADNWSHVMNSAKLGDCAPEKDIVANYTERVNDKACDYLSRISFDNFKKHVYKKTEMDQTGDILKIKDQWEQCKQYCSQLKANNYRQKTGYKYGTDHKDGRLYAAGNVALQRMCSAVRNLLLQEDAVDIDMKMAGQASLRYLCKKHNIKCPELDAMFRDRDKYLSDLMKEDNCTREEAKNLLIRCMTCGWTQQHNNRPLKSKLFAKYDKEIKELQQQFARIYSERLPSGKNQFGKLLADLTQLQESKWLQAAITAAKKLDIETIMPQFDGFLCWLKNAQLLLEKLNTTFHGHVVWVEKEITSDVNIPENDTECDSLAEDDILALADVALQNAFHGRLAICNGCIMYVDPTGELFTDEFSKPLCVQKKLELELKDCDYQHKSTKDEEYVKTTRIQACLSQLAQNMINAAPYDDDFENKFWKQQVQNRYTKGIELWNAHVAHIRSCGVFLYSENNNEPEELELKQIIFNMRAKTAVTAQQWLASSKHRSYAKDVFVPTLHPDKQNDDHYNHFRGLAIQYKDCQNANKKACQPILDHIKNILCSGDETQFQFIVKSCARILQGVEKGQMHWIKTEVCILFISLQGTGKGSITEHMRRIIGKYAYQCSKKD
eukprot:SAG25_NODE_1795_length_2322_cov_113.568601_1_plen_686_part_10